MVERLEDMPEGTLGFRISGEIHRADYTGVLEPELRAALEAHGGLRTLYLIEELKKIEPSALWETPSSASTSVSATTTSGCARRS